MEIGNNKREKKKPDKKGGTNSKYRNQVSFKVCYFLFWEKDNKKQR